MALYLGPDASPRQLRTEQVCRREARALRDRFPIAACRARVFCKEGIIAIDWHRAAKIEILCRDAEPTISWNMAALEALGIEGAEACSAVASSDPPRQSSVAQWCLSFESSAEGMHALGMAERSCIKTRGCELAR